MSTAAASAFDQPPRGFAGLSERLSEREIAVRWDQRCPMCGGGDPLALGTCLSCLSRSGDRLLFLRRPALPESRRRNLEVVRSLLPPETPEMEVGLVASGHLALAAVPASSESRIQAALKERGLFVRSGSTRWSVASTPASFNLILSAIAGVGAVAAVLGVPQLVVMSPIVAILLWLLSQSQLRRPVTLDPERTPWLASVEEARLVKILAELPPGRARFLLVDLVRLARLLHARAAAAGDMTVAETTGDLLLLAADVAADLAELQELAHAAAARGDKTAAENLSRSCDRLDRMLLVATQVLSGCRRPEEGLADQESELMNMVHEIDRGRAAYRAAFREMDELLEARKAIA